MLNQLDKTAKIADEQRKVIEEFMRGKDQTHHRLYPLSFCDDIPFIPSEPVGIDPSPLSRDSLDLKIRHLVMVSRVIIHNEVMTSIIDEHDGAIRIDKNRIGTVDHWVDAINDCIGMMRDTYYYPYDNIGLVGNPYALDLYSASKDQAISRENLFRVLDLRMQNQVFVISKNLNSFGEVIMNTPSLVRVQKGKMYLNTSRKIVRNIQKDFCITITRE